MASLHQISATLGACMTSNNNINKPCIAQLYNKRHFISNLVTNHQIIKPTLLFPLALVGQKKPIIEKWKARGSDDGSCGVVPEFVTPPSRAEVVKDFYEAFNAKDTKTLEQLLSPNCVYEDFLYYGPYQHEETINFLQSAMDAMGQSIQISVEDVKEENHLTATAFWHLEWKKKKIPFTNGCRFFMFEEDEGGLLISKITGVEELPVKPGELLLKLIKAIRTLFDSYPLAAEAILDSHASQDGSTHGEINKHLNLFGWKRRS